MTDDAGLRIRYSPEWGNRLSIIATPKDLGWSLNTELQSAGLEPTSLVQESAGELDYWTLFLTLPGSAAAVLQIAQAIRNWRTKNPNTSIKIKRPDGTKLDATGYSAEDIATILATLDGPSEPNASQD